MCPLASEVRRPSLLPPRKGVFDSSLVLYAPLWHPQLSRSPFTTLNPGTQHLGTVTGVIWGKTGGTFNGDDLISFPHNAVLNILDNITIIADIKCGDPGASTNYHIYEKGRVSVEGQLLRVTDGMKLQYLTSQASAFQQTRSVAITANVWQQVAVTRSGTSALMYKNGASLSLDQADTHTNPTTTTKVSRIGVADALAQYYVGDIGAVWIYNQVLTAGQIRNIYLATRWRYV